MKWMLLLALGLPGAAYAADAGHTIMQKGRVFRPADVRIGRGESLTFTNNDDFIHQIYVQAPGFSFDTEEKNPGQNVTQTFTSAGTFEVRCHIHPKMKLVVRVR
jgi:plastocyanin